jgi:hypothetical protein
MKMLFLLVGLALGFGGGVWWGVHHPTQASSLSAAEERQFIQLQIKTTQAVKDKLNQIAAKQQNSTGGKSFGSGFLAGGGHPAGPDPDIVSLANEQDRQLQELQQHLAKLNQ